MDELPALKGFSIYENQAVLSLPWCNLRCPYCYAHRLVLDPDSLPGLFFEDLVEKIKKIKTLRVTGGEPLIHRNLPVLLQRIKETGTEVVLDTNGTQPEVLGLLLSEGLVDRVDLDIKAPLDDAAYSRAAGVDVPAELIRMSLKKVMETDTGHRLTWTLVPGLHAIEDAHRLAAQLQDHRFLVLRPFDTKDPMDEELKGQRTFSEKELQTFESVFNY